MKLKDLLTGLPEDMGEITVSGIACDSRKVGKGYAFVCISGSEADGHVFAPDALENGAAVLITQRDLGLQNQVVLPDTRKAYAEMCAAWFGRPADSLRLIGVTGTNGKTTVSYLVKAILEQSGYKVGLIGTIQNMIGQECLPAKNTTPSAYELHSLFSLMKTAGCQFVVMEVSSHALDQQRVGSLHFETALFTNLTQDHLDYHGTMENYKAAKKKLFEMCDTAVLNYDDPAAADMTQGLSCKTITYSALSDEADYSAREIAYRPDGVDFQFVGLDVISRVRLKTAGRFSVYNALCAGSCAVALGIPIKTVAAALSGLPGVKGRAEVVPTGRDFTVVIDYAHTPDGLENILKTFQDIPKNRLVVLFGCGGDRDRTKRPMMGEIAARLADYCIVTSDNPRSENPSLIIEDILAGMKGEKTPYTVVENRVEAIKYAIEKAETGDIIVLAGKGHETYQILGAGTIHLDEREVVAVALQERARREAVLEPSL
ncbi:MAG: UDP-N-acetylmuramoyl-L-alanyl-D-glutamate--2,6-diaminopimelate ligase [Clostridiales bacterium]|nr:UDP-N-acetylmuramoyl-L-alanyl-D-glutamate--2,6-diaminopimelate ligase [Clostridiales bacterium]